MNPTFLIVVLIFDVSFAQIITPPLNAAGPVGITTESGESCVPGWRTCSCGPLLNSCTIEESFGRPWCATAIDPVSRVYTSWDWCETMVNCSCMTETKKQCHAFNYDGQNFTAGSCTYLNSPNGQPWCATCNDFTEMDGFPGGWQETNWDYCNPNCGLSSNPPCPSCPSCSVDGNWSPWGAFGPCSVTCGNGTHTRTRTCTNPPPSGGGAQCQGAATDTEPCGTGVTLPTFQMVSNFSNHGTVLVSCPPSYSLLSCGFTNTQYNNTMVPRMRTVYPLNSTTCYCSDQYNVSCNAWCTSAIVQGFNVVINTTVAVNTTATCPAGDKVLGCNIIPYDSPSLESSYNLFQSFYPTPNLTSCLCSDPYEAQCVATCASGIAGFNSYVTVDAFVQATAGTGPVACPANSFVLGCGANPSGNYSEKWPEVTVAYQEGNPCSANSCSCYDYFGTTCYAVCGTPIIL